MKTNYSVFKVTLLITMMVILSAEFTSAQGPDIDLWYGDDQTFGQEGVPQRWINILGNVSDADGVNSLYYTLNGSSNITLSIGPDSRRLQSSGDFNIDLSTNELIDGANEVIITATDNLTNQTEHTVTVNFTSTNVWPIPYDIDWQAKAAVNEVSQAVDGNWEVTPDGIHTVTTGYDRLVAIGDTTWDDYEISVPVTIHSINSGNGIGVLLRWMGHTDSPVTCLQPKCGYLPLGAICWYRGNRLEIYGNDGDILATQTRSLDLETIYMFKARVETNPGIGGLYSFKVWEQSETEPAGWDITGQESLTDPQNGCLLLISHHGDVTFGNLSISSIPISITNIQALVHSGNTGATISWNTNIPASSQVAYGTTSNYELGNVADPTLVISHSLELTGLSPDTEYHYQISSVSAEADEAITGDLTFTTVTSDIASDDFHLPLLNTSLWTFVDPVGDCDYDLVGSNTADAWLNFMVPAGTEHQLWEDGIQVPHVRQNCNNADFFEVEAKFESPVSLPQYQEQGILVRQDDDTFIRFEFFSRTTGTFVYVESFVPGSHTNRADLMIGTTGLFPLYMRVKRQGDQWIASHSTDSVTWTQSAIFTFAMTVTGIGPYAGNAVGGSSPAFTGSIDYFFNTAAPVDPEDPVVEGMVIITSTPVTAAVIGQLYTYDVEADGTPAPTFSLLTAPTGMTIDDNSGLIEWTPDTPGDFDVSVQASNAIPSVDIQDFVIHVPNITGGIVSDDFSDSTLNTAIWSFIDPLGDGGYTLTGTCTDDAWINISVPGGPEHQMWENGIMAPHILQASEDTDFELEVKFESSVSGAYQEQGILVKGDESNFLRFEFFSTASNTFVYAATVTTGLTSTQKFSGSIGNNGIAPLYMRVNRTGNQWTQHYSLDDNTWIPAANFAHTLVVTAVGTYAGNGTLNNSPAHTSSVDYFFNTASPVVPEDPTPTVDIAIYNTTCGDFEVKLKPNSNITNTFTNIQFTIKWPASTVDLIDDFDSDFGVDLQGNISVQNDTNYAVFVSIANIAISWTAGTEYTILSFSHDQSTTGYADFEIDEGSWASANNGEYYVELLGLDYTGIVYGNATNVYLGRCGEFKVFLQGTYDTIANIMNTDLSGNLPLSQPYNVGPWNYTETESVIAMDGSVVDWVLVELRSDVNNIAERKAALLLEDGKIVQYNNILHGVHFDNTPDGSSYYIVVHHRNHMPVMTAALTDFNGTLVNFTNEAICYGSPNAEIELGTATAIYGMIAGDINSNGWLSYSGPGNDRGLILARIVEEEFTTNINDVTFGYFDEDVLMDYEVKYIGGNNDRAIMLTNLTVLTGSGYINAAYQSVVPMVTTKSGNLNNGPIHIFLDKTVNEFQVKIITDEVINDGIIDNIQFTLSWDATLNDIVASVLKQFQSDFGLLPQGEAVEYEGKMYLAYVSVIPVELPDPFTVEDEVILISFTKDQTGDFGNTISIADNVYTNDNNGMYYISLWGKDHTGTIHTSTLGNKELQDTGLSIYPNPVTSGIVHVEMNLEKAQEVTISVSDIQGKIVHSQILQINKGSSKNQIELHMLTKGIYYIKVQADNLAATRKLILL